jgi:hypothetical protein
MLAIEDGLLSLRIKPDEVTVQHLKTGGRSITDVALQCLSNRDHLLGKWLDNIALPSYVKEKARLIFADHASYRREYNPVNGTVDTTWLFAWPTAAKMLLQFLEGMIYIATPQTDNLFRMAVKNSNSVDEILSWSNFAIDVLKIHDEVASN